MFPSIHFTFSLPYFASTSPSVPTSVNKPVFVEYEKHSIDGMFEFDVYILGAHIDRTSLDENRTIWPRRGHAHTKIPNKIGIAWEMVNHSWRRVTYG